MTNLRAALKELLKERLALDDAIAALSRIRRRGPGRPPGRRRKRR